MPVNQKKMKAIKKGYGAKKGKEIYYATENKQNTAAKKVAKKGAK